MSSETQVLLSRDNANGVRVAHATTPSLNTDHTVAFVEDTQLDGLTNTPLQALVDIFLPVRATEIRLWLREVEGIDTTVQMSVSSGRWVSGDHDDRADRAVFGENTGGMATMEVLA
jgi:hypothetical protein